MNIVTLYKVVTPYSEATHYATTNLAYQNGSPISSFCNHDSHIYTLAKAISGSTDTVITDTGNWNDLWTGAGKFQRHDINPDFLETGNGGEIIGARGLGARLVTVGYMLDNADSILRLKNMASDENSYIDISANSSYTTPALLAERLLDAAVYPGGRNAVLRDEISEYFFIPDGTALPPGVSVKGYEYGLDPLLEQEHFIFRSSPVSQNVSGQISITLYNVSRPDLVEFIEDPEIPLFPGIPTCSDEEIIEISETEVPLANFPKTGDSSLSLWILGICIVLSSASLIALSPKWKKR